MFNGVKLLLVGPPQVGKTTTKLRLLGDMDCISKKLPSTGLEKPVELTWLDSKTAALIDISENKPVSTWRRLATGDLAKVLVYRIEHEEETKQDVASAVATADVPKSSEPSPHHMSLEETAPPTTDAVIRKDEETAPPVTNVSHDETDAFLKTILKEMAKHKEKLIEHLNKSTTVYLIDTGGQPEFHDLLPLLLRGPAFYLIFFSLEESLDGRYTIKCTYNSPEAKEYISGHSIKDVLYQMLNSFTYFNIEKEDKCCVQPQAFVIATHLDKVSPERVKAINEQLREALEFTDGLPVHDMLVDATSQFGSLFIPIDNYKGTQEDVETVRNFLTNAVKKSSKPVRIATPWLLFHVILRNKYEEKKVCTFEDSVQLATRCGINREDVKDVLTYIYRKLGTILYFEDVPSLSHLVICNPEIIYQAVSNLIFSLYEKLDKARNTGLISDRVFKAYMKNASDFLGTDYILELLKHFRILASVESGDSRQYFMPCVLHTSTSEVDTDTEPLIFCFPFRPNPDTSEELRIIPIGLATGLVVHLMSLPPTQFNGRTVNKRWKFARKQHFKNQYHFHAYEFNMILLVIRAKHIELYLTEIDDDIRSAKIQAVAMKDVEEGLVHNCHLYNYNLTPNVRLFCKSRQCGVHFAEYNSDTSRLSCTEVKCPITEYNLEPFQKEWFNDTCKSLLHH